MAIDNIPPPPFLGPIAGPSFPVAPRGWIFYTVYQYRKELKEWRVYGTSPGSWESLPLGYYRTPANFTNIPMCVVVTARTNVDGTVAPIVLSPQDAPIAQGIDCPDGYGDVDISELALDRSPTGDLLYWTSNLTYVDAATRLIVGYSPLEIDIGLVGPNLQSLCAVLAVQKVPTCPDGFTWDPVTETCKANPIITLIPPPCPPGTHWDPTTETCQPDTPPPPPFTTGKPCIPVPSPDDDELGDYLNCVSENLIVIQQLLQQQKQGGGGGDGNLDPVTCSQLTQIAVALNFTLQAIARAISNITPGGTPAPDFTTVVQSLEAIANAIASQPEEKPVDLTVLEQELAGDPTLQAFIDQLIADKWIDAPIGQLI